MDIQRVERLYRLGMGAYTIHDYENAIASFKAVLAHDFRHAYAHFYLALSYQKTDEYELSLEHFGVCNHLNFDEAGVQKSMAYSFQKLGMYREAIFRLQKHLKKYKDDHETYELLAKNYALQAQIDNAIKSLAYAVHFEPKEVRYHTELAKLHRELRNYDAALNEVKKALALDSRSWEAFFICASLYAAIGVHEKAVKYYQKSISFYPKYSMSYNNMAISLLALKEEDQAYKAIKKAVKYAKKNQNFYKNLQKIKAIVDRKIAA